MSRRTKHEKRDVLPDPVYNSKLVTRLINRVMFDGKRGTAQTIIYHAFSKIEEKTGKSAMDVFATAISNIMPGMPQAKRHLIFHGTDCFHGKPAGLTPQFIT